MRINYRGLNIDHLKSIDPAVEILEIQNNQISSLTDCPRKLPNLRILRASHNKIADLSNFPQCPQLTYLDLSHNHIRGNITSFLYHLATACPHLTTLVLNHNQISKIAILDIEYQHFHHNHLSELVAPRAKTIFQKPKFIDLSDNELQSLAGLPSVPKIEQLRCQNNPIETLHDMIPENIISVLISATEPIVTGWNLVPEEEHEIIKFLQNIEDITAWERIRQYY